ncbi:unnamed protein product, partial [Notodromas monacha]
MHVTSAAGIVRFNKLVLGQRHLIRRLYFSPISQSLTDSSQHNHINNIGQNIKRTFSVKAQQLNDSIARSSLASPLIVITICVLAESGGVGQMSLLRVLIGIPYCILAWLDEPVPELQVFTLQKLNEVVDEFWAEISEHIEKIEVPYEDKNFSHRNLAALVASKVFYHLGSYQDSLYFALGAAGLFDVNSSSQYVTTIVAKCIDHYTKLRLVKIAKEKKALGKAFDDGNFVITGHPELIPSESVMLTLSGLDGGRKMDAISRPMNPNEPVDPRLEQIVDRMFQRCFDHGQFKQALGIALETRRMDVFEKSILSSDDVLGMLSYAFKETRDEEVDATIADNVGADIVELVQYFDARKSSDEDKRAEMRLAFELLTHLTDRTDTAVVLWMTFGRMIGWLCPPRDKFVAVRSLKASTAVVIQ